MNTNAPEIVLIGRNSADLEKYRSEISRFPRFKVSLLSSIAEISSFDCLTAVFIDGKTPVDFKMGSAVPVILIMDPLAGEEIDFAEIPPHFRVLKKPLYRGEVLHEIENILQTMQLGRLRALREMLKGLTHELGNIVLRIIGRTDLALMSEDVEKIRSELKSIMKASLKASELVKNLRSFAKSVPELSTGHLSKPIEEAIKRLDESFQTHKIVVHREGLLKDTDGEPEMVFDPRAMTQVFFNLFENALQAMAGGGELWVKMTEQEKPRRSLVIKIRDSGTGMEDDVLKRAFDVAFSTKRGTASGLGLPVAQELILHHQGRVEIQSTAGQGTEITVWLPVTLNL